MFKNVSNNYVREYSRSQLDNSSEGFVTGCKITRSLLVTSVLLTVGLLLVAGCNSKQPAEDQESQTPASKQTSSSEHAGWWCAEHGVPEEECSICSASAAEQFKANGDWCETHIRAKSQCFLCDPSRAEKFVALYEAKFGKKPPKPGE